MKKAFLTPILAIAAIATPANAGWGFTEWGMSPTAVVAASNGKASASSGTPGDALENSSLTVRVTGREEFGSRSFRSIYYFDGDQLKLIKLTISPERGCGLLWNDIRSTYGKPTSETRNQALRQANWDISASNARLTLLDLGGRSCRMSVAPLS